MIRPHSGGSISKGTPRCGAKGTRKVESGKSSQKRKKKKILGRAHNGKEGRAQKGIFLASRPKFVEVAALGGKKRIFGGGRMKHARKKSTIQKRAKKKAWTLPYPARMEGVLTSVPRTMHISFVTFQVWV